MRIVFCWPQYSGYMAACWRALQASGRVDFHVLAFAPNEAEDAPFSAEIMSGLPHDLLPPSQHEDAAVVAEKVVALNPEIVVIPGWFHKPYRALADHPKLRGCKFVMCMDNPWLGTWKQQIGRYTDRRFRAKMDAVVVPGERGYQFARRLGFRDSSIYRGVYGVDETTLTSASEQRQSNATGWPKRFLFIGRYAPVKGLDTLLEGFRRYRENVDDPWTLTTCGGGDLSHMLTDVPGVENLGFTQPTDLPSVFASCGCFVLCSRYDPWPLVVVESCMAGLPVVCSAACGSAVELVRPLHNGLIFGTGDADSLSRCLQWMHAHHDRLPKMGRRSTELASAYSAARWADRWDRIAEELLS